MIGKKGLAPLIATVLLLMFAVVLGIIVMGWGRDYVQKLSEIEPKAPTSAVSISDIEQVCADPLLILQTRYARGEIGTAKYLEMKAILEANNANSS